MTATTRSAEKKRFSRRQDPCDSDSIENISLIRRASGNYWRILASIGAACAVLLVLIIIL